MTLIRPDANNNPRARSESPPPAAAQAPASPSRQLSRIGVGAGEVGHAGDGGEPLRRPPSPARQPPAAAPTAAAPEAAGQAGSSDAAAHWRAALATAPRAAHWNDLAACRAVLLRPMADPRHRRTARRFAAPPHDVRRHASPIRKGGAPNRQRDPGPRRHARPSCAHRLRRPPGAVANRRPPLAEGSTRTRPARLGRRGLNGDRSRSRGAVGRPRARRAQPCAFTFKRHACSSGSV